MVRPEYRDKPKLLPLHSHEPPSSVCSLGLYANWPRVLTRWVAIPVLGAQLLFLTGIITGLYVLWISICAS